jgi:hypothetical protein
MGKSSEVKVTNPAKAGLNTVKSSEFHFCIPVKLFSLSSPIFNKAKICKPAKDCRCTKQETTT